MIVARPSRWANPYPIKVYGRTEVLRLFREYLAVNPELVEAARTELRGYDLACYCNPSEPCHADIWLELVNAPHERTTA